MLLANVWHPRDENTVAHLVQQLLDERFPDEPPRFLDTPYGYGDHDRLRTDLEGAGWENVELEEVRTTGESASAEDAALGYLTGTPLSFELAERRLNTPEAASGERRALSALGATALVPLLRDRWVGKTARHVQQLLSFPFSVHVGLDPV